MVTRIEKKKGKDRKENKRIYRQCEYKINK